MERRSERTGDQHTDVWLVGGFALLAAVFHLLSQSWRPLWLDEASTYWTVQARAADILQGVRTDGTPPLYFLIVSLFTHLLGSSEIVLRLPSILAAILLVPASYLAARLCTTRRAAIIAAALAAISPLVHFYAVEARSYTLVQLETVAILYLTLNALDSPRKASRWILLCLAQSIQLWTHNYALFLLPVPALVSLLPSRTRWIAAPRAAAAALVAFTAYLPWFFLAQANAQAGVGDWIRPFWQNTPPSAAIFRSLEAFGFGGSYPVYLSYLAIAPDVHVLAVALTLGLLLAAVVRRNRRPRHAADRTSSLLMFLFTPLIGAWLYSYSVEPLYLVGRYDTIVLPVCLILLAIGLDNVSRLHWMLGSLVATTIAALAVVSSWPAMGGPLVEDVDEVMAARYLAQQAADGDPIVFTGYRRPVVEYYLARSGRRLPLVSFPPEIGEHPGWFSETHLLGERDSVERQGENQAASLAATANGGHAVWVLVSPPNEIDTCLYRPLLHLLANDTERTVKDVHLLCLKPR